MALSDSTFLLDICVELMKPLDRKEVICKVKLPDLLELYLLDLKGLDYTLLGRLRKNKHKKRRHENSKKEFSELCNKEREKKFGQTIILPNKDNQIIFSMDKHNLELSLWSKTNPDVIIGTSIIPWTQSFINYLKNISTTPRLPPVVHKKVYNIENATHHICLGTIKTTIKLVCMASNFYKFISGSKNSIYIHGNLFSNPEVIIKIYNAIKKSSENSGSDDKNKKFKIVLENDVPVPVQKGANQSVVETNGVHIKNEEYSFLGDTITNPSFVHTRTKLKEPVSNQLVDEKKYNAFEYIFGDPNGYSRNRIYCVNYFTVKKDKQSSTNKGTSGSSDTSEKSTTQKSRLNFRKCKRECVNETRSATDVPPSHSLDLQPDISSSVKMVNCKKIACDSRVHRKLPMSSPTATVGLDFTNIHNECCNEEFTHKIEEFHGEVSAKINYDEDPCFCTCECRFGFTKRTTYCNACGGFILLGDDFADNDGLEMPMPCPIFHKLVDKSKLKTYSTSGSESRKKGDESLRSIKSSSKALSDKRLTVPDKKVVESEKESKKGKHIKRNQMFYSYGYKAPHIGHSNCASPCTGQLDNVPKSMGWFWTADDIPGMKFRSMWKPGAINKQVLRLLRLAGNSQEVLGKKKKKDMGKSKRALKRPLLIVHKKDGEYTVTMETMKLYSKPRAIHQYPYEDKPVLTYTIGRTEEENKERQKKKDREQRRLERDQRMYIQRAFKNMCHEICMKTYQQALGILPNAEDPNCPCYPALPMATGTNVDVSCSCSEDSRSGSTTDSDEWVVEFTPPNAIFDPSFKGKRTVKMDNGTQYSYLDYRVKLVDRHGNPVPRFFKGPDGKEECSDLGGFFNPDHKWLEINVDGFIGPDGKWAPNTFIGPSGETVDAETGKFQDKNLQWLVVGVDGYVNPQGKWKSYSKYSGDVLNKRQTTNKHSRRVATSKKAEKVPYAASWSCFGDTSPTQLSRLGISGHGKDKRYLLSQLQDVVKPHQSQQARNRGK